MADNNPTVNGMAMSWADIDVECLVVDGPSLTLDGFSDISWKATLETGDQRPPGSQVSKLTTGNVSYEASITFYKDGYRALVASLVEKATAAGGRFMRNGMARIGMVHFDLLPQFTPLDDEAIYKTKIVGVRFLGTEESLSNNTDPAKVVCLLKPRQIIGYTAAGAPFVLV